MLMSKDATQNCRTVYLGLAERRHMFWSNASKCEDGTKGAGLVELRGGDEGPSIIGFTNGAEGRG